jgi:type III secretory pathway component EscV
VTSRLLTPHGLVAVELPHLDVLSFGELAPDFNIQPIGRISLPEAGLA